ncbi:rho GTPase-activating protein REN1-like isoform X2 [Durio zibethinus]|uniref:Rho GTPase-activating protein REN1-like isoform X2 n=1 Tax=Durio zibethinus TaxID=66656 RepID=A0A6P6AUC2_DURZI|nr:rho GTPase-activating protein REN1-like isoform X2 [Durio zibethinus]
MLAGWCRGFFENCDLFGCDFLILSEQRIMATKKDEPSQTQQKMPSKKEEPSQTQQKMPSKKEEPSQAQHRMASKKEEPSQGHQGEAAAAPGPPAPPPGPPDHLHSRTGNSVLKSGSLFLSSKGIGWTSWKKRWFILTHTSLVFFRSDPNAVSQKGNEVNLTLGGIDLNNSGSVVVKADKKLITVLFQDGRDGRTFTLKAETLEDLYEWKAALENALSQAPCSAHVMGQNGVFGNDQGDAVECSKEPVNDKQPVRSTVVGRPILLALEDVDGAPTFLEKALRFVEEHGIKVEGILRQAADVEDVERRIREYEQGKSEFSPEEDPHVIADCVKYVIRELPSSPVPASCCNALLEACRTERGARVNAMRMAVLETFPEPNRRLLQRILMMMQTVASNKTENLMSSSAVAACMAPLLLRPLLAGDCEIENDFDVGGDGSIQLLQAAAAANHAQAIVITLLEEYDKIFGEGSVSPDLYSDTEESGSESEEATDDDESYEDDEDYEDDECDDATRGSDASNDDDYVASGTGSYSGHSVNNGLHDDKDSDYLSSGSESSEAVDNLKATKKLSSSLHSSLSENDDSERSEDNQSSNSSAIETNKVAELSKGVQGVTKLEDELTHHNQMSCVPKSTFIGNGPGHNVRRPTVWGRTAARKNLSMESIDFPCEEEAELETLEAENSNLQKRLTEEIEGNAILEASLEKRKKTLYGRRLALEKDVARLEEELQRERDKRAALEAGLNSSQGPIFFPATIDEKIKADLKDIAQAEVDIINLNKKVDDLGMQLNQQLERSSFSMNDLCNQHLQNHQAKTKDKPKGNEAAFERSGSKDKYLDEAGCEKRKKQESSSANKHPLQNQQSDHSVYNSNRMTATETFSQKPLGSSNSKKSATKGEGANSTSSALSKLTTRLNFLKERRSQIANEILGMEKGRSSSQAVPSPGKGKGPEPIQSVQNPEKGRGPDISQ